MLKKILILITIPAALSHICYADEATSSGFYLNPEVGYANINHWWTASPALTLNGGWQFNQYLSSEVGYTWINPIVSPTYAGNYSQYQSFSDAAAKVAVPFSDIFNAYAKAGVGVDFSGSSSKQQYALDPRDWNGDVTSYGLYLALGGELKLSQQLALSVEDYGMMPLIGHGWGNINVLGVGAKYLF